MANSPLLKATIIPATFHHFLFTVHICVLFKHLDSFFIQLFTIPSAVSPEYCKLKNILVESVLTDGVLFTLG